MRTTSCKSTSLRRLILVLWSSLLLVSAFIFSTVSSLAQSPAPLTPPPIDPVTGVQDLRGLTLSDLEKLYPTSPEEEAAIVHTVPQMPVIIDGVPYPPEGVLLFNGKRLRFVEGNDGKLYAFTKVEEFEKFLEQLSAERAQSDGLESVFFLDWWYGGQSFSVIPGQGRATLPPDFDNAISSVQVSPSAGYAYLFDLIYYSGDSLAMTSGSSHSMLSLEGWNDRASSVWASQ